MIMTHYVVRGKCTGWSKAVIMIHNRIVQKYRTLVVALIFIWGYSGLIPNVYFFRIYKFRGLHTGIQHCRPQNSNQFI